VSTPHILNEPRAITTDDQIKRLLHQTAVLDTAELQKLSIVNQDASLVDKTPWLRMTQWPTEFAGMDMGVVFTYVAIPKKNDVELNCLWKCVERVVLKSYNGVGDCKRRNWRLIPFWLNSTDENNMHMKPFGNDFNPNKYAAQESRGFVGFSQSAS
jgi:hypothetical protein